MRELKDPKFISSLPRISINQLPIKPLSDVPTSPAVWFALDDTNTVLYVGQAEKNLRNSLSRRHPKMKVFKENGVSSIAYCVVEEKPEDWAKEAKKEFSPRLNQNRSEIFLPAIHSLIKRLNEIGLKQRDIRTNARNIGFNFLNDFENKPDAYASKLEEILLSEYVNNEIFEKHFIPEIIRLWKSYKEHLNAEQESKADDKVDVEDPIDGRELRKKKLRIFEQFQRDREKKEWYGKRGEEFVNAYLHKLQKQGNIKRFEWISSQDFDSPHDFLLIKNDSDILIDVKSTSEKFECDFHISRSQLKQISCDSRRYDIYRIFDINEESRTAKLRIAEDVRDFAKQILKVFENLPRGVSVDGISVSPLNLNFQGTEKIDLPDEPEEEAEPNEQILADLKDSLRQVKAGQTFPISELWDGIDV